MIGWLLAWLGIGWAYQEAEKRQAEAEATRLAKLSGKPILSIGAKCNPFGDVRCDIEPRCGAVYCDAEELSQFGDKEFSVALLSHVIEHLDDPDRALAEAERVADNVLVITPNPIFPQTWLNLDHKWVYFNDRKVRIRGEDMKLCQRYSAQNSLVEMARTLCLRNGEVMWGREGHSGTPSDVWINPGCPEGGKVIGIYHSHPGPGGTTEPSSQDIKAMQMAGLQHMCISDDLGVVCHRVIRER